MTTRKWTVDFTDGQGQGQRKGARKRTANEKQRTNVTKTGELKVNEKMVINERSDDVTSTPLTDEKAIITTNYVMDKSLYVQIRQRPLKNSSWEGQHHGIYWHYRVGSSHVLTFCQMVFSAKHCLIAKSFMPALSNLLVDYDSVTDLKKKDWIAVLLFHFWGQEINGGHLGETTLLWLT